MKSKHEEDFNPNDFHLMTREVLDQIATGTCECCNEGFSLHNPAMLTPRCCGAGAGTECQYWGGFLYVECASCGKPVFKIEVV